MGRLVEEVPWDPLEVARANEIRHEVEERCA